MGIINLLHKYKSDKVLQHEYGGIYEEILIPFKDEPIILLELGTGGYIYENKGGLSAKAFRDYFQNGLIITVDMFPKTCLDGEERIKFYQGDQNDPAVTEMIIAMNGSPSIIIDDASHINPVTLESFKLLWPSLKSGGLYIIEDTNTSYVKIKKGIFEGDDEIEMNFYGGDHPNTVMNYFKGLTDSLNWGYCYIKDIGIFSITFYREIIVIKKK